MIDTYVLENEILEQSTVAKVNSALCTLHFFTAEDNVRVQELHLAVRNIFFPVFLFNKGPGLIKWTIDFVNLYHFYESIVLSGCR